MHVNIIEKSPKNQTHYLNFGNLYWKIVSKVIWTMAYLECAISVIDEFDLVWHGILVKIKEYKYLKNIT